MIKSKTPWHADDYLNYTWEQWSRAVIDQLIERLDIPNGDAQALFETMPEMTIQIWHANYSPQQAAKAIDTATSKE